MSLFHVINTNVYTHWKCISSHELSKRKINEFINMYQYYFEYIIHILEYMTILIYISNTNSTINN